MPLPLPQRPAAERLFAVAGLTLLLSACNPAPQGGFQGFPPAAVTTLVLQPRTLPVSYEYVRQTAGSREVEVRARVTGILEKRLFAEGAAVKAGQALFVIDPKPLEAQAAAAEAEVARVRAQVTQADREVHDALVANRSAAEVLAAETARREQLRQALEIATLRYAAAY